MDLCKVEILFIICCAALDPTVLAESSHTQSTGIRATMRDELTTDNDGDGRAESGDTLTYTIIVTNTGTIVNGIGFSATPDVNTPIVPGSIEISPMAIDDSYTTFGGSDLVVNASDGLLSNDFDPDGDPLSIAVFDATSTLGAVVLVNPSDGSFTYQPPGGFQGTDMFSYGLDDGFGGVVVGTATVTSEGQIWFVDNTAPQGGDGSMPAPFDNLADAETSSASGDTIFVFRGDGTDHKLDQGFVLKENQRFLGQGFDLKVGDQVIVAASGSPVISNTSHTVVLASGSFVAGFTIGSVSGSGMVNPVAPLSGVEVREVTITQTGEAGIRLASADDLTLENISILNSHSDGVAFGIASGSSTLSNIRIQNASGDGIVIADSTKTAISISGIEIMNVTGSGLHIADASGNLAIDQLSIDGTDQAGLSITNHQGSVTINNGSIRETLGQAILVEGAAPSVTYNGQIDNGDDHLLSVVNTSGGAVALSGGPFTDVFGLGIEIDNCLGGVSVSSASL
ncbi:MAG: cadherin-like domain-containing protein, partial [Candidatus Omnitrophica bacterium]|nr:cadherin-like domain-containing protein [Candidatus Omnitrophota bacterium]